MTTLALEAVRDQPRAVALLTRALASGRIAQAYAFVGPPGSGRTSAARALAKALLCERGGGDGCRACALVASRQHPDLHIVSPTPPDGNPRGPRALRIGAIRELERQASLRPAMAGRRVLILDDADRMTEDAPQAFLKFLEEPPTATTIILVLASARAVPATVLSRCQLVRFAARGDGSAASLVREVGALVAETRAGGPAALFKRTDGIDRERAETLVDGCWLYGRDLLLARAGAPATLLTDATGAETLRSEAAGWTDEALLATIEACRAAREALVHNVTPRLTVEMILTRLVERAA